MKSNYKGLSRFTILLVAIIIVLVSGAGWYVWQRSTDMSETKKDSEIPRVNQVEITDSSKTFIVTYPDTWSVVPYETPGRDGPTTPPETDWSKMPQPITLRHKNNKYAEIRIDGYTDINTTIDKEIAEINKDKFNTYEKVTINGYEALKHVLDFVGPSDAEKYKETTYIVLSGSSKVTLKFRERYSNATTNGESDFDASNLSADFEKVVNSIKFLD